MSERIFGDIPGINEGQSFASRLELSFSGIHRPVQAGISGSQNEGADSIVLSGGYEDDKDYGDVIVYTGHGGRDQKTGKQVTDQELTRNNLALAVSCQQGLPVRVVRGNTHKSFYSPESGYRYDGLFRVEKYWKDIGESEFVIWRFELRKIGTQNSENFIIQDEPEGEDPYSSAIPKRIESNISRIVRDTFLSKKVKGMYSFKCQVCNTAIQTNSGLYAEAAHIRPLGTPHNGPDSLNNLLCLCPNHHVQFDFGGFAILDNFELVGELGKLFVLEGHNINPEYLKYHREHFFDEGWR